MQSDSDNWMVNITKAFFVICDYVAVCSPVFLVLGFFAMIAAVAMLGNSTESDDRLGIVILMSYAALWMIQIVRGIGFKLGFLENGRDAFSTIDKLQ